MPTLVTGSRGLVGRHLVTQLLDSGEEVIGYNRDFTIDSRTGLQMVQGELFDIPRLLSTLRDHQVDRIIHTAGMSHPGLSVEFPITTFSANMEGTLSVFESARLAGISRVVNFSSECAYGNLEIGVQVEEDTKPIPTTPYGVTKVAGELLGGVYNDQYQMSVVSLRITEVYGPGLWMPSLLADMLRAVLAGDPFILEEGADHPFQFVYVEDVATAATLASLATTLEQPTYHVSGGTYTTLAETAELVRELVPGALIEIGPGCLSAWDRMGPFDLTATGRDIGYVPSWTLPEGLASTAAWIASAGPAT